jgi:hypothetical protein
MVLLLLVLLYNQQINNVSGVRIKRSNVSKEITKAIEM